MRSLQLAEHGGRGVSVFTELRHRLRIAFTGTGVAVLMGLSLSSIAHADEAASLEDLVADPTASISRGLFKVDDFHLLRFPDDPSLHVEVSLTGGGIRFTGDYEPDRFDSMSFTVTESYQVLLFLSMAIAFDADPLNPDVDAGSAWVSAMAWQTSTFPPTPASNSLLVCTQGTVDIDVCGTHNNLFFDQTDFFEGPRQVQIQLDVANDSTGPGATGFRNVDVTFGFLILPEPSSLLLLSTAALALLVARLRRIA
jgi:hypothetical protein